MLNTPIGKLEIYIDEKPFNYDAIKAEVDKLCPNLMGRYKIEICFVPDGKEHYISCILNSDLQNIEEYIESGERLECKGFYSPTIKLSIGAEGDSEYINSKRISDYGYDYDVEYIVGGIRYVTLPFTKTQKYVFGIAWIDSPDEEREVQTWFGADPTII